MTTLTAKTILIIEDDLDISLALSTLLKDDGHNVLVAENGASALLLLKSYGIPHLILLDMMMPVMNGWQFAKEFNCLYDQKDCPIIVMTAAENPKQLAKEIEAMEWIAKPFSFNSLLLMIKKYIAQ
jgi:CheY-like chemotaxis protein